MLRKIKRLIQNRLGITQIIKTQDMQSRKIEEILKASVFNSAIMDSKWLQYKSFTPGGWAVDYALLYTLYRVLNEMHPTSVLEFGLGQSSKMIHQYAAFYDDVSAVTCEHDLEWETFFKNGIDGEYEIKIKNLKLAEITYGSARTLSYENIEKEFSGQQYDLILVDAPFGSKRYSRPQILHLVKTSLKPDFCIMIDDYDRSGEQETVKELMSFLDGLEIKYLTRVYSGSKQHFLICSENMRFLTSM